MIKHELGDMWPLYECHTLYVWPVPPQVVPKASESEGGAAKRTEPASPAEPSPKPPADDSDVPELSTYQQAIITTIGGKCASAIFVYLLANGLASFSDVDPFAHLEFVPSDIATGMAMGLPVGLAFAAVFMQPVPSLPLTAVPNSADLPDDYQGQTSVGLDAKQLKVMREVDEDEEASAQIFTDTSLEVPKDGDAVRRGVWWWVLHMCQRDTNYFRVQGMCRSVGHASKRRLH